MTAIPVKTSRRQYPVFVGHGLLSNLGGLIERFFPEGKIMLVTQRRIAKLYLKQVRQAFSKKKYEIFVHLIPDGESAKSQKE